MTPVDRILAILPLDTPIPLSELAELSGMTRREAEQAIQDARLAGHPIVSDPRGMKLGTDAEALEWCQRASRRVMHQLETVKAVERGVERRRARQGGFPWAA